MQELVSRCFRDFIIRKGPEGFDQLKSGGRVSHWKIMSILVHLCTIDKGVTGDTIDW